MASGRFEVYQARVGQVAWRLRAQNTEVAVSPRLYQRHLQAEAACALFVGLVANAELSTRYARIPPEPVG
jgi:uncharacterized protein YegP (UPF0339 family)